MKKIHKEPEFTIWDVQKMLGFRKIESQHYLGGFYFVGIFGKGEFELFDYSAGILEVKIGVFLPNRDQYADRPIYISNIDDGDWAAYAAERLTFEQLEEIVSEFAQWKTSLPSEVDLNAMLSKFKIYGHFE